MRRSFLVPETLETARLTLRLPRAEDLEGYAAMVADPEVNRFVGGATLALPGQAFRALGWLIGHWQLRGYGPWIVTERASGALVGRIGGYYPLEWPAAEITWTLARPFWGKGYAEEASRAARDAVLAHLRPDRLVSLVATENERSAKLARRLGCTRAETILLHDTPCIVFEHPREAG